jgi:sugar phosphate isomerase/epimerase
MGEIAAREGVMLLVENEASCNVGTCAEFAGLIKLLPEKTVGINWDANNGQSSKEKPFPEGYALLPKSRIKNVHMHGRTLLDPEKLLDWRAIFAALIRDGYAGCAGLETHYFDGTKIEKSHLCMNELLRITA